MTLAFPKPKGKRKRRAARREGMSAAHLRCIRMLPSCVSGRMPCDAHHLRKSDERGVGMRATDRWALPLTRDEHTTDPDCVHSVGSEREVEWFKARGVNPYRLAEQLWAASGNLGLMRQIIEGRGQQ